MPIKKDYAIEAGRLAKAIDIAIDSLTQYPPEGWDSSHIRHIVKVYSEWKYSALHPTPEYKKMASLNQKVQEALTPFQETMGKAVDYFWKRVAEEALGYKRVDGLRKALDRGKIRGRLEYDQVTDTFIAAKQEGRITQEEADRLSKMLGEFEERNSR